MRRTLAIVATGLVLGSVWAATAAADMYSMRLNSPAGTPAP